MNFKKYSLWHVIKDQYGENTKKNYNDNVFTGDSIFLAHVSNKSGIADVVFITALLLSIPFYFISLTVGLVALLAIHVAIVVSLSLTDTHSTRKYRVRINLKKTIDWVFNKDPKKRKGDHC